MFKSSAYLLTSLIISAPVHAGSIPKNIILMIGDGMGPSYTTAYRHYADNPQNPGIDKTIFDQYLVGMASTYPDSSAHPDESTPITDSAASATALASGRKTYNGAIGVDIHKKPLTSVLRIAKQQGKATGIVATSTITHATPAAFIAQHHTRYEEALIADQFMDNKVAGKIAADVMLGGGLKVFQRKQRNLVQEFKNAGYHFVNTRQALFSNQNEQLLGLFAQEGLPRDIELDNKTPSLSEMTTAAIKQLRKNSKGFFLMVESSQIDWAGHSNDVVGVMSEMTEFSNTIEQVIKFAKQDGNTLVVITADHNTGGLSIGRSHKESNWHHGIIRQFKQTSKTFIYNDNKIADKTVDEIKAFLPFSISKQQMENLVRSNNDKQLYRSLLRITDEYTNTGWSTGSHTGVDVQIFATGPGSEFFFGHHDNTDIGKRLIHYARQ